MSELVEKDKLGKMVKSTFKVTLIIFLIIIFFLALRIINNETCGTERYTSYDGSGLTTSNNILNSSGSSLMMESPYSHTNNIQDNYFCFTANATETTNLEIISYEEDYGLITINEGYDNYCQKIVISENDNTNYIGLRCEECSSTKQVTFYKGILGEEIRIVHDDGTTITGSKEKSFDWNIRSYNTCWKGIKFFSMGYLILLFVLLSITALIVGTEKLNEVLFNDW